jgi:uncharacterized protein YeaO (DUF488 family)
VLFDSVRRAPGEGLRIGTVRRPPRGVPRSEFARQDWYDVWFPTLSPSAELVKQAHEAKTAADWTRSSATTRPR